MSGEKKPAVIYHVMRADEDFEKTAHILHGLVRRAIENFPGVPRWMYLDIEGHRNTAGGFDVDAFEIQTEFLIGFLAPFLTRLHYPLCAAVEMKKPQSDDLPETLMIKAAS